MQFSNQLSSFTAGEPDLNFRRDKKDYFAVWGADVDLDLIAEEMQQWMRSVQKVFLFHGVVSHTYIHTCIHTFFFYTSGARIYIQWAYDIESSA